MEGIGFEPISRPVRFYPVRGCVTINATLPNPSSYVHVSLDCRFLYIGAVTNKVLLYVWQAHHLYGSYMNLRIGIAISSIHIRFIRQGSHSSMIMPLYTLYTNRINV